MPMEVILIRFSFDMHHQHVGHIKHRHQRAHVPLRVAGWMNATALSLRGHPHHHRLLSPRGLPVLPTIKSNLSPPTLIPAIDKFFPRGFRILFVLVLAERELPVSMESHRQDRWRWTDKGSIDFKGIVGLLETGVKKSYFIVPHKNHSSILVFNWY